MTKEEFADLIAAAGTNPRQFAAEIADRPWAVTDSALYRYINGSRSLDETFLAHAVPYLRRRALARLVTSLQALEGLDREEGRCG